MKPDLNLLCLLPVLAFAQPKSLALADCLRIAHDRDPQTRSDSLAGESASLQEKSLNTVRMPSVNAVLSYNRLSGIDPFRIGIGANTMEIAPNIPDQYAATLRIDQLVWDGNGASHRMSASRHDRSSWNSTKEKDRRDLSIRIATAYWNLSAAQAAAQAASDAMARADSQANLAAISFRQGTALEQDTLQARLRTRQIEIQFEQAQASREFAIQTLCVAMGLPLSYDLRGTDTLKPLEPAIAAAKVERPELAQVREQILSAQELVAASKASYQPTVTASAQYDYLNPNQRIFPNHDQFDGTWRVGVAATWNLFRGGADELSIRKSELAVRQARQREAILLDATALELSRRETELRLARRRREIAERNVPLARRDLDLANIRSQAGTALRLEAIDRASALSQTESDLAQAIATENIAAMNLSVARGEEPRWK